MPLMNNAIATVADSDAKLCDAVEPRSEDLKPSTTAVMGLRLSTMSHGADNHDVE